MDAPEAIDQGEKEVARLAQARLRRLKAELRAEQFVLGVRVPLVLEGALASQ